MTYSFMVGFGLQGVYFLLVARLLGPADFGIFSGALAVAMILSTFSGAGAGNAMVIAVSRSRVAFAAHFGTVLIYVLLTALPLGAIGILLGAAVGPQFLSVVAVLLLSELVFTRVVDFCYQSFQAHDRLSYTAHMNVGLAAVRVVVVLAATWAGLHEAIVWAAVYAVTNIVMALAYVSLVWIRLGRPAWDATVLRTSWRTGVFFSLGMASRVVYTDGDKYVLNLYGQQSVAGEYSAASRLVTFAFAPVQALVYASNTALYRAGERGFPQSAKLIRKVLGPVLGLATVGSAALFLLAPLVPLLLGEDYSQADEMMRMLSLIPILMAVHLVFGDALMGLGRQSVRAIGQFSMATVGVALNLLLIPQVSWYAAVLALYVVHAGLLLINVGAFWIGYRSHPRNTVEQENEGE